MRTPNEPNEFQATEERRWWLLRKALERAPLEAAIALARAAEAFVTGVEVENAAHAPAQLEAVALEAKRMAAEQVHPSERLDDVESRESKPAFRILSPCISDRLPSPKKPTSLPLSPEQRERMLQRLATGAKNAELAAEFGVSARQVQGVRMGSAREISRRRFSSSKPVSDEAPKIASSVDEVVRYLRQRDDIVVPLGDGGFVVNGRFRLDTAELLVRANRMRRRHGKPEFEPHASSPAASNLVANGHPG